MALRSAIKRGIPPTTHPIQRHPAYEEFINRSNIRDPLSIRKSIERLLREMEHVTLNDLTPAHVDRAVMRLLAEDYDASYVDRMVRSFKAFMKYCAENRYIERNVAPSIKRPHMEKMFMPVVIPPDTIKAFTVYILKNGTADEILYWSCLKAGCRLTEPLEAKVKHIALNLESRTPYIWLGTKTDRRRTRIATIAFDILVKRLDAAKASPDGADEYIITSVKGTIKDRGWSMRERFKKHQMACFGEIKFTPKDIRSTFITNNINAFPEKLMEIAAQCGNSVATIQRHYFNYQEAQEFVGLSD